MSNSNEMVQGTLFDEDFGLFEAMNDSADHTAALAEGLKRGKEKKSPKKDASGKPSAKTKKGKADTKLLAPVTVVGCSWRYLYEGEGEVDALTVAKAAYDRGFTEVALARLYRGSDPSILYVNPFEAFPTDDDRTVPFVDGKITVVIGEQKAEYTPEDFDGTEEAEISILDLTEKYVETHLEFQGMSLCAEAGLAVPVLEAAKEEEGDSVSLWQNGSVRELPKEEFHLAMDVADDKVELISYRSENRTVFACYKGESVSSSCTDFGVSKGNTKVAEEKYHLPFTISLANFNKNFSVTQEHFPGKRSVTQEEVLSVLKKSYKMYAQKDRKIDWIYDKKAGILSVAVSSGKKGSAAQIAAFPVLYDVQNGVRIEKTGIGTFYGTLDSLGNVCAVRFQMTLPKIPMGILSAIRREFSKDLSREAMAVIRYQPFTRRYSVYYPSQQADASFVRYRMKRGFGELEVMQIHSHHRMRAFWSKVDDEDEVGLGLFGVLGKLHTNTPEIRLRAGMEGVFAALSVHDLFDTGGIAA